MRPIIRGIVSRSSVLWKSSCLRVKYQDTHAYLVLSYPIPIKSILGSVNHVEGCQGEDDSMKHQPCLCGTRSLGRLDHGERLNHAIHEAEREGRADNIKKQGHGEHVLKLSSEHLCCLLRKRCAGSSQLPKSTGGCFPLSHELP